VPSRVGGDVRFLRAGAAVVALRLRVVVVVAGGTGICTIEMVGVEGGRGGVGVAVTLLVEVLKGGVAGQGRRLVEGVECMAIEAGLVRHRGALEVGGEEGVEGEIVIASRRTGDVPLRVEGQEEEVGEAVGDPLLEAVGVVALLPVVAELLPLPLPLLLVVDALRDARVPGLRLCRVEAVGRLPLLLRPRLHLVVLVVGPPLRAAGLRRGLRRCVESRRRRRKVGRVE